MEKKYKLPKKFSEKWLEALRSGEYKQSRRALVDRGGYCCLGVAVKVVGASDEDIKVGTVAKLYPEIPDEIVGGSALSRELVSLNDFAEYTLPQIADWIEVNVELY